LKLATSKLEDVSAKMDAKIGENASVLRPPVVQMKNALNKLKSQVVRVQMKCAKSEKALERFTRGIADEAHGTVMGALRDHMANKNLQFDVLYKEISAGSSELSIPQLRRYVLKLNGIEAKKLDLALDRYADSGLSRFDLAQAMQEYMKCVKDTAMTDGLAIQDSKVIRKLTAGETVEVLESAKTDTLGLSRVRCRALLDNLNGFVSVRGNQGTSFLERCRKPLYVVVAKDGVSLDSAFECGCTSSRTSSSTALRVCVDEVLEVLEGPREEPTKQLSRLRGKAKKDGKMGWVTSSDGSNTFVDAVKVYVCRQATALTSEFDISKGSVLRRIDVDEILEPLEEVQTDEARGITRVRLKCSQDGKDGWVTVKGNMGSEYIAFADKAYICRQAVPLELRLKAGSDLVRQLEAGESFEVLEGPKIDNRLGTTRLRCRSLTSTQEGWFTVAANTAKPWNPRYRCKEAMVLSNDFSSSSKVVRKLESREVVEALAAPSAETGSGLLRVRCRAEKDSAVGYATVRGKIGSPLMEAIPDSK